MTHEAKDALIAELRKAPPAKVSHYIFFEKIHFTKQFLVMLLILSSKRVIICFLIPFFCRNYSVNNDVARKEGE